MGDGDFDGGDGGSSFQEWVRGAWKELLEAPGWVTMAMKGIETRNVQAMFWEND